jgi:hypothetical protein
VGRCKEDGGLRTRPETGGAESRIRARPAAELRDEERYEILNRMVEEAFPAGGARPGPLEMELFNRYFDVRSIFYYVHPAWWTPRYGGTRGSYEITDESEPARFGESLGWVLQADGDRRRNEFLNSPFVRVCVPIRAGLERATVEWLAAHVEGQRGFTTASGTPIGTLLERIEQRRQVEGAATPGPDYISMSGDDVSSSNPTRTTAAAEAAYPVVEDFEILVPTDGFAYQKLEIEGDV